MLTPTVITAVEAKAKVFSGVEVIDVAAQQIYFDEAEQKCQLWFAKSSYSRTSGDKHLVYF